MALVSTDRALLAPVIRALDGTADASAGNRLVVPIEEWIESPYYSGPLSDALYPFWRRELVSFFNNRLDPKAAQSEVVVTGSLGAGKSYFAEALWLRFLYELSCLNDPQKSLGLAHTTTVYLAYLSVSMEQAEKAGFGEFRAIVDDTAYFRDTFPRDRSITSVLEFPKRLSIISGSDNLHTLGQSVISGIIDEANFFRRGGGNPGDLAKVMGVYQGLRMRIRSRFLTAKMQFPGLGVVVSSATHSSSFTDQIIKEGNPDTRVVRVSLWDTKPKGTYSDNEFVFYVGDELHNPQVVESAAELTGLCDYVPPHPSAPVINIFSELPDHVANLLIKVPETFKSDFLRFPLSSLTDFAGVSSSPQGKLFTSKSHFQMCVQQGANQGLVHPFSLEELTLGMSSPVQMMDYFQPDIMFHDGRMRRHPDVLRYFHIDQGTSHDSFGIACSHCAGVMDSPSGPMPVVEVDFLVRITPPAPPDKICLDKVSRLFIPELKRLGMPIGLVTYDQWQSESNIQFLVMTGISAGRRSVDRTDETWLQACNYLYCSALRMYEYPPLRREFFQLDHNRATHKVDHPKKNLDGSIGSKDICDAFVGSLANCVDASRNVTSYADKMSTLGMIVDRIAPSPGTDPYGFFPGIRAVQSGGKFESIRKIMTMRSPQVR